MRIWFKEWKDNHLVRDTVIEDDSEETRTHKILGALDRACNELDLSRPIWLEATQQEFLRHARARFTGDAFIDPIDFDFLEIHVIEED
mgnify:CR=1 FL=1